MCDKGTWRRQTFCLCISHHFVCAKWDKLKNSCADQITNEISTDIDVSRIFSEHRVFDHSDACQVVFKDVGGSRLLVSEITECLMQIYHLLSCLASCYEFSFQTRERDVILPATFPRNWASVNHPDVACVRPTGVCVATQSASTHHHDSFIRRLPRV